jgi:hypothetical protein
MVDSYGYYNEQSGYMKDREFLDKLSDYQLLKSAP